MKIIIILTNEWIVFCVVHFFSMIFMKKNIFYFNLFINRWKLKFSRIIIWKFDVSVLLCSKILQRIVKWLSFRIYNEAKHNNAILIKTKNLIVANGVATRTDLIKNKKTKIEKTLMSMSVTADDEINSNKFKRKRSDRWYLKDMNMQNKYRKKIRKLNAYWYCFICRITIY